MKRFFETIRIENGEAYHLDYHEKRLNATIQYHFTTNRRLELAPLLSPPRKGLYRCKVIYSDHIESIEYFPYRPRSIHSFKLVHSDSIEYRYKSLDRSALDTLFARRGKADEIIIVQNGLLTDTSIANIALLYKNSWLTPQKPLLAGTTRERLLERKKLQVAQIEAKDITKFEKIAIMNAMIDFCVKDLYVV